VSLGYGYGRFSWDQCVGLWSAPTDWSVLSYVATASKSDKLKNGKLLVLMLTLTEVWQVYNKRPIGCSGFSLCRASRQNFMRAFSTT